MPLLGFTMFREKILSGEKKQTIRALRKHRIKVGDRLYLYWKLRTKQCEKLGEAVCTVVFLLEMPRFAIPNGRKLHVNEIRDVALRDGFHDEIEMRDELRKLHKGKLGGIFQVIRWDRLALEKIRT